MLDDPALPVLEVPSVGLAVELPEDAEVDAEELGVDGVTVADALGCCVLVGVGVGVGVGLAQVPAALGTFGLFAALRVAVESVGATVAVPVGVAVAVAVLVGVAVAVAVLVGVPLVVPLLGLGAELAGVTLGVAGLLDVACAAGDDVEVVWHAVAGALL